MSSNLNIIELPNDFFWETYLNLNPELQKNNNKEKTNSRKMVETSQMMKIF